MHREGLIIIVVSLALCLPFLRLLPHSWAFAEPNVPTVNVPHHR